MVGSEPLNQMNAPKTKNREKVINIIRPRVTKRLIFWELLNFII